MKLIDKIWNLRLLKQGPSSIKIKALKALGGFLAVMLAFTVLSRAASAMTVPQVTTEKMDKRTINHQIKAEGTIQAGGEQAVSTLSGLKIKEVHVTKGQKVEAGEPLLSLDLEYLKEELRKLEIEAEKFGLQISETEHNQALKDEQKARDQARAQEDYNLTAQSESIKVDNAYREMVDAYNIWMNAENNPPAEGEEQTADLEALRESYEQKKGMYNEIVAARDQALIEKDRAIADANAASEKDSSAKSDSLDKEASEMKIADYQKLVEQDGKITSPLTGIITFLDETVVTGGITPETGMMRISDTSKGFKFAAQITKKEKKYLKTGDEVTLLSGEMQEIKQVKIESITKNSEDEGMMDVIAYVGANDKVQLFDTLTMNVSSDSNAFNTTISQEALHKGGNGESDYVLAVEEKESVMGAQLVVQKLDVTVEDSNDQFVAVADGELSKEHKIITSADKEIEAGDRIRLAESDE